MFALSSCNIRLCSFCRAVLASSFCERLLLEAVEAMGKGRGGEGCWEGGRDLKSRFTHIGEPALYDSLLGESKRAIDWNLGRLKSANEAWNGC